MATIDAYYPPSPKNVPEDLTRPSASYRNRVLLTLVSLLLFFVLYLGFVVLALAVSVLAPVFLGGIGLFLTIPSFVLFLFLIKNFFKRGDQDRTTHVEITEDDQPLLFAFVERLCEETGAPRPRKVFVSPDVNAAVLSKPSILSLFFPGQKDLLIGLGLVNVLTLSEFKAVLAHEFGHFSQSSLKVGGYVYVANRIIYDMVFGRDGFDFFLDAWCRVDIRIAWVAWLIKGVLWLFRKMLEGFFYVINLSGLSLSREQEFHADLVAVSVAGSDAGVHAFYRLGFADETWEQALGDLSAAAQHKLYSSDLYYHLNHTANYLRKQKKDPKRGLPPPLPTDPRATPDLFQPDDDTRLRMWATHPSHHEREQNAKEYYIRSRLDDRSAWVLFDDPRRLREKVTYKVYRVHFDVRKKDLVLAEPEEVQAFIDDERAETTYDDRYHGLYDDRLLEITDIADLTAEAKAARWDAGRLERVHGRLYDAEMKAWVEAHRERCAEHQLLSGLAEGHLELQGDDLEFRGRKYDKEDAERLLKKVDRELEKDRDALKTFDRRVFLVAYQMASACDAALAKELARRYEFHAACQDMLRKLMAEKTHLEACFASLENRRDLESDHFQAVLKALRDAHRALTRVLDEADDMPLPELKNMKKGKPLGYFLMDKRLVPRLGRDERSIGGDWKVKFYGQVCEVFFKLKRIHFKSLGAILLLQDRIYREWAAAIGTLPTAEPLDDEPPLVQPAD